MEKNTTEPPYSVLYEVMTSAPNFTVTSDEPGAECLHVDVLYSHEFFNHTNLVEKIFMFVCVAATAFTVIDCIYLLVYVKRHYQTSSAIKLRTYHVLGIYPAISVVTVFALFIPQADLLCELASTLYISRSMFHFVSLMTLYFGGKGKLLQRIKDDKIGLRAPPLCCCCPCLPQIAANQRNLTILKSLVLQAAIVLPLLNLASVVLWLDGKYSTGKMSPGDAFPYLNYPSSISTLLSLYAFILLYRLCRKYLGHVSITPKFISLQLVIALTRIQSLIMGILASNGIPACRGALSTVILSQTYKQMLVILEMLLLSLLARKVYKHPHDQVAKMIDMETHVEGSSPKEEQSETEAGLENGNHQNVEREPLSIQDAKDDRFDSGIPEDPSWLSTLDSCRESKV